MIVTQLQAFSEIDSKQDHTTLKISIEHVFLYE